MLQQDETRFTHLLPLCLVFVESGMLTFLLFASSPFFSFLLLSFRSLLFFSLSCSPINHIHRKTSNLDIPSRGGRPLLPTSSLLKLQALWVRAGCQVEDGNDSLQQQQHAVLMIMILHVCTRQIQSLHLILATLTCPQLNKKQDLQKAIEKQI